MKMSATKSLATHRVFAGQMNEAHTLFGGQTVSWLDEAASISAHRFARRPLVTAGVDHMTYVAPVAIGDAVMYHSIVTGAGKRSLEVFTRIVGERMAIGEHYLVGYAWLSFVTPEPAALPALTIDDDFGAQLHAGYAKRRAANAAARAALPTLPLD